MVGGPSFDGLFSYKFKICDVDAFSKQINKPYITIGRNNLI